MGKGVKEKISAARLRSAQKALHPDEYYAVSYKEVKGGITYIRIRWVKRKPTGKRKRK